MRRMEWTDEGIVLGTRRHGEANAILEVHDPRAWPPSRPGARRRRLAPAPGSAAGQLGSRRVARAARRAPRQLHGRGIAFARGRVPVGAVRRVRRDAPVRVVPAAARARSACRRATALEAVLEHLDDPPIGRGRCVRFELTAGRARLRPRSDLLRRDRPGGRSRLRVAEVGPRGLARGRRALARGCCDCRRSSARTGGGAAVARRPCRRLRAHRLLPRPRCARAARPGMAGARAASWRRLCVSPEPANGRAARAKPHVPLPHAGADKTGRVVGLSSSPVSRSGSAGSTRELLNERWRHESRSAGRRAAETEVAAAASVKVLHLLDRIAGVRRRRSPRRWPGRPCDGACRPGPSRRRPPQRTDSSHFSSPSVARDRQLSRDDRPAASEASRAKRSKRPQAMGVMTGRQFRPATLVPALLNRWRGRSVHPLFSCRQGVRDPPWANN